MTRDVSCSDSATRRARAHPDCLARPSARVIGRGVAAVLVLVAATSMPTPTPGPATAAPPVSAHGYRVPLPPRPRVVRAFADPEPRWHAGHRGVDLSAAPGVAVVAAGDGVVRFAGSVAGKPTVSIAHDDGIITTYEPVRAIVSRGTLVRRGTVIGFLETGHPGCDASACLHWGARRGAGRTASYLDPLGLLGAIRVRLKPVESATDPVAGPG